MSEQSGGPGWWQASDGKWYPPEQAPTAAQPTVDPDGDATGVRRAALWRARLRLRSRLRPPGGGEPAR